ncbi:MAG: hypothetical protein Q8N14_00120 [Candidatus Omnitrophota bacterium]|nr:hypothetical protein [Candidatus Omnitrophota bacterium]
MRNKLKILSIAILTIGLLLKPLSVGFCELGENFNAPKEAIDFYKQQLENEPDNVELLIKLGNSYLEGGSYLDALEIFERVTGLRPSDFRGHANLAWLYNKVGAQNLSIKEYDVAIPLLEQELKNDSSDMATQRTLFSAISDYARVLEKTDMPDKAITQFQKLRQLTEDNPALKDSLPVDIIPRIERKIESLRNKAI